MGLVGLAASPGIVHADCTVAARGGVCMTGLPVLTDESHPVSLIHNPAVVSLQPVLPEDFQEHVPADQSE